MGKRYMNLQFSILEAVHRQKEDRVQDFVHQVIEREVKLTEDRIGILLTKIGVLYALTEPLTSLVLRNIPPYYKTGILPDTLHPQLLCFIQSWRTLTFTPTDPDMSNPLSDTYIDAHERFCKHYDIDPVSSMKQIIKGDELAYLLNVTATGRFADTSAIDRMKQLQSEYVNVIRDTDGLCKTDLTAAVGFSVTRYNFNRIP